jgi:hypothetical protein
MIPGRRGRKQRRVATHVDPVKVKAGLIGPAEHPQLELKWLPGYSPQRNVIERFWKMLRRRADSFIG